jgi:uncharacterized protein YndB with AHSA1/START domain
MTDDGQPGERIIGSLAGADGKGILRLQDRVDTDIDDLWSAFVDPERLNRWLGQFHGDLRLGGEFRAHYWASGWEGTGRVEACEPPHHLLVVTREAEASEDHAIEVWLRTEGNQTVLVIEQRGLPLDLLGAYGAGGQVHVEDLVAYLAGRERGDAGARWEQLTPAYAQLAAELG